MNDTFHENILDQVSEDDRQWFDDHPQADRRLRAPVEHEFCNPDHWPACVPTGTGLIVRVEVHQIQPGVRSRQPWVMDVDRR